MVRLASFVLIGAMALVLSFAALRTALIVGPTLERLEVEP